jgi:hypothetical protein
MDRQQAEASKPAIAAAVLNDLNCPNSDLASRVSAVVQHLGVYVEQAPDPMNPGRSVTVHRVRVAGENGPRMVASLLDGQPEHFPLPRLIRELWAKVPGFPWKLGGLT